MKSKMKLNFAVPLFFFFVGDVFASNILAMSPLPLPIYKNSYTLIFKELARKGHNVTVLSPFPQKKVIPNLNEIIITDTTSQFLRIIQEREVKEMNRAWFTVFGFRYFCKMLLDGVVALPELKSFLNDTTSKYDLLILEAFICQEPFLALGHKYGVPVVAVVTNTDLGPSVSDLTGNTFSSSYVPNCKFPFTDHMNFWERLINLAMNWVDLLMDKIYYIYIDYYMRSYFVYPGFEKLPTLTDMVKSISLFLMDNHISLSYPRPYLPNVIHFGGLVIESENKLPEDIETFLNDSKDGVILLSWGQIHLTYFSSTITSIFLPVIAKLKQRVLIKWENDKLPGKPENVKITQQLHQASVLAHPNVRLFITHGGFDGISEAIYHGVPLLGTPVFGKNFHNLKIVEEGGFGLTVDINTLTRKHLQEVFKRLLSNTSFKENAMKRSRILRDRPMDALDNAVYWIEYVLRHNGASHFRPPSLGLPWYQYWALDVMAVLAAIVLSLLALAMYFLKCIFKLSLRLQRIIKARKSTRNKRKIN